MPEATLDRKIARLQARGTFRVHCRPTLPPGDVFVRWWPTGQEGNPFCGEEAAGPLEQCVDEILEATKPTWSTLDDLVARRLWRVEAIVKGLMACA